MKIYAVRLSFDAFFCYLNSVKSQMGQFLKREVKHSYGIPQEEKRVRRLGLIQVRDIIVDTYLVEIVYV